MGMTLLRFSVLFGIGGSLLAVAVPTFVKNLHASKTAEALDGLDQMTRAALAGAESRAQRESFPPSVERTPDEVPRGVRVVDPPGTWDHLTWRALRFSFQNEHAYSFQFDSSVDPATETARFSCRAFGDLDGDGTLSTFEARGERAPGAAATAMAGLLIRREVE
jgi:type II secretory pathway pseudopilin PulG